MPSLVEPGEDGGYATRDEAKAVAEGNLGLRRV